MSTSGSSAELVMVRSADHGQAVLSAIKNLFDSKRGTDLEFRRGERSVKVHRLILELLLAPDVIDDNTSCLDSMMEFLYKGEVAVPKKQLQFLLKAAREMGFQILINAIVQLGSLKNVKTKYALGIKTNDNIRVNDDMKCSQNVFNVKDPNLILMDNSKDYFTVRHDLCRMGILENIKALSMAAPVSKSKPSSKVATLLPATSNRAPPSSVLLSDEINQILSEIRNRRSQTEHASPCSRGFERVALDSVDLGHGAVSSTPMQVRKTKPSLIGTMPKPPHTAVLAHFASRSFKKSPSDYEDRRGLANAKDMTILSHPSVVSHELTSDYEERKEFQTFMDHLKELEDSFTDTTLTSPYAEMPAFIEKPASKTKRPAARKIPGECSSSGSFNCQRLGEGLVEQTLDKGKAPHDFELLVWRDESSASNDYFEDDFVHRELFKDSTYSYKCTQCEYCTSDFIVCVQHLFLSHLQKYAPNCRCKKCDILYLGFDNLKMHLKWVHPVENGHHIKNVCKNQFACPHCRTFETDKLRLFDHMNLHHGNGVEKKNSCKMYRCPICKFESQSEYERKTHLLVVYRSLIDKHGWDSLNKVINLEI